jgi:hypothetical protein
MKLVLAVVFIVGLILTSNMDVGKFKAPNKTSSAVPSARGK